MREVRSERGVVTLTKSLRLAVYGLHPADLRERLLFKLPMARELFLFNGTALSERI